MKELNQNIAPLFDAVKKYISDEVIRFDVPGHKQGRGIPELRDYLGERVLQMDVNGPSDLDCLSNPTGVILEAEELLAGAFTADKAFFLVNGTTSGIQAMIMSSCQPGDKIILPRNIHKSVIGGIILSHAVPVYVQPEINSELGIAMGVSVESVKKVIAEHPDAKAMLLINPTYYGAASDIKSIVEEAHARGIIVLVDEAHGAHMYFHDDFPLTAMKAGADMSTVSIHKTAGSLTQSSALLMRGNKIAPDAVKHVLNLTCTTSASYLLMCSLDAARKQLAVRGFEMLGKTLEYVRRAREGMNHIPILYAFGKELVGTSGCYGFDETKLGVNVRRLGYTGYEVQSLLRKKYNIQIELSDLYNILSIVTIGDREEDLNALTDALADIASNTEAKELKNITRIPLSPKMSVTPREAFYCEKRLLPLDESAGEIAGEMIMAYPPGIPIICMGEEITQDIVDYIKILKEEKCELLGTSDPYVNSIRILKSKRPV